MQKFLAFLFLCFGFFHAPAFAEFAATLQSSSVARTGTCVVNGGVSGSFPNYQLAACQSKADQMMIESDSRTNWPAGAVWTSPEGFSPTTTGITKHYYCNGANATNCGWPLSARVDAPCPSGSTYNSATGVCEMTAYVCPANATLTGTTCTCNADYDQSGSSCVAHVNACTAKAGVAGITNWTVGYSRTPDANDMDIVGTPNKLPASQQICDSGCLVDLSTVTMAWQSQVPTSQGLYRWSIDLVSVPTGAECTMSSSDLPADKTSPNPTCPGFVGEINGVKGCYGTASSPVVTSQADRPVTGKKPGNPAAGPKPSSGEGSGSDGAGRTPGSGDGGAAGGPSGAAAGPTGSVPSPDAGTEQAACGAPGQPKCSINEAGTPSGVGTTFDAAKSSLDANKDALSSAISGAQNIQAPSWSFSFALPTGCTPYDTGLRGFVMNPCQYQGVIHDLMSMLWAAVTAFAIISMVGRTIRES